MNEPSSVSFADTFPRRGKARLEGKVGRQGWKARYEGKTGRHKDRDRDKDTDKDTERYKCRV